MPRPSWNGHLKLSLVACPVALYTALDAGGDVRFHNRVRMVTTDAETGDELQRADLVKGYEFEKDRYVVIDKNELEAVKLESTKTIDIEKFVPASEIDRIYWERPYYMAPDGKVAVEAFAVIREAMTKAGKVALGRVVISGRERLLALEPRGNGILATTLRSHDEVRGASAVFDDISEVKPEKEMILIAEKIIQQKADEFDPEQFTDRYAEALRDLIQQKLKGRQIVAAAEPEHTKVIDLMAALKQSLGDRRPPAPSRGREVNKRKTKAAPPSAAKRKRRG